MANKKDEKTIEGVMFKNLTTYPDERGFFREMIRVTDDFFKEGFAQLSHSLMYQGSAKAWHIHKTQIDWWYVSRGTLKVALNDRREGSKTFGVTMEFLMGENQDSQIVKIPPGVAHGCKCILGPADLLYVTSTIYNTDEEGRLDHDDPDVGYDWLKGPDIK